jgi:hypothetical protein
MNHLKARLKRVPWLSAFNARIKSVVMARAYRRTLTQYANHAASSPPPDWRTRAAAIEQAWRQLELRVLFIGTDEQQDKSGMLQALQAMADVRAFTRDDGTWGQNDPAPYARRLARNTARLLEIMAANAREGWTPHVLLMQTWACLIAPETFSRLREEYGVFVINIAMDDRHQYWGAKADGHWDGTYPLIPHIDLTLTAAPEAVHWYRCEGGMAIYFPEASDADLFHPMPHLPRLHDVSFVGSRYGIRADVVEALRCTGVDVAAWGNGWENGRIALEAVPVLFAQSRIVLGVSAIGHSRDFVGLKLRDFDAPLSGSCYLTQHNADLEALYCIGEEIVTYRNIKDCVAQVQALLANPGRLAAIGAAGRARAMADHTWRKRFTDLFQKLGEAAG